jgi:predicted DNA binding CopG/RHH family protein
LFGFTTLWLLNFINIKLLQKIHLKKIKELISEVDLELLQERALIEGLLYQTLMSGVLHKYVTGRLS